MQYQIFTELTAVEATMNECNSYFFAHLPLKKPKNTKFLNKGAFFT